MNFVRTISGLRYNCRLGPRASFNEISSIIDAGTVYSNSAETQEELRAFKGGLLKVNIFLNTKVLSMYLRSNYIQLIPRLFASNHLVP